LDDQLNEIFRRLGIQGNFYSQDPQAQQLQQQLSDRASGADAPYNQGTIDRLVGQEADGAAAGFAGEQDQINQFFANSGLSGSGVQGSAVVDARRRANAATRSARRDITSRADLSNFQAKETAQQQLQTYVAQREMAMRDVAAQEIEQRSRIHATGDADQVLQAVSPSQGGTNGQPSPATSAPAPGPALGKDGLTNDQRRQQTQQRWGQAQWNQLSDQAAGVGQHATSGSPFGWSNFDSQQMAKQAAAKEKLNGLLIGGFGGGGGFGR
jgi:hypothetical protein